MAFMIVLAKAKYDQSPHNLTAVHSFSFQHNISPSSSSSSSSSSSGPVDLWYITEKQHQVRVQYLFPICHQAAKLGNIYQKRKKQMANDLAATVVEIGKRERPTLDIDTFPIPP